MPDVTTVQITAGLGGTVTAGGLVMLILQNVKALMPRLAGQAAEVAAGIASLVAVVAAFALATDTDWTWWPLYVLLFISWMSLWVGARATYSLLFKVSVAGGSMSSAAGATVIADPAPDMGGTVTTITPQEGQQP